MKTHIKIGTGQLFCLFALSRVMYSMLYHTREFTSGSPLMWAQLIATLAELILGIPLFVLLTREEDIFVSLPSRPWARNALIGAFALYFVLLLGDMLSDFLGFMAGEFGNISHPLVIAAVLWAVWSYTASLGIQGLARSALPVFILVMGLIAAMAFLTEGEIHLEYLTPMTERDIPTAVAYGIEELSSNWWLPMGVCLSGHIKNSGRNAGLGYLFFKLVFVEGLIFAVTVILWQYMNVAEYPILALGSYARTDFIQQFDAVNMFFWTLNSVIVGGSFCYCAVGSTEKRWLSYIPSAAATLTGVAVFYGILPFPEVIIRLVGVFALGVILPLAAILRPKGENQ